MMLKRMMESHNKVEIFRIAPWRSVFCFPKVFPTEANWLFWKKNNVFQLIFDIIYFFNFFFNFFFYLYCLQLNFQTCFFNFFFYLYCLQFNFQTSFQLSRLRICRWLTTLTKTSHVGRVARKTKVKIHAKCHSVPAVQYFSMKFILTNVISLTHFAWFLFFFFVICAK